MRYRLTLCVKNPDSQHQVGARLAYVKINAPLSERLRGARRRSLRLRAELGEVESRVRT